MNIALWIVVLMALMLVAIGIDHRRQSRKNNAPTHALWWHIREEIRAGFRAHRHRSTASNGETASPRAQQLAALSDKLDHHNQSLSAALHGQGHRKKRDKQNHGSIQVERRDQTSRPASGSFKNMVAAERAISDPTLSVSAAVPDDVDAADSVPVQGHIRFIYRSDGQQSQREVKVRAIDRQYLKGFCLMRGQIRTFRLDRIIGKVTLMDSGEVMPAREWIRQARDRVEKIHTQLPKRANTRNSSAAFPRTSGYQTVFFAGVGIEQRRRLESVAEACGYRIRDKLDASVDIMVTGPMTGERQLFQATTLQIRVLDEKEFARLGS